MLGEAHRILVVDFRTTSASTIGELLGRYGFACEVATELEAALDALRGKPDLVLIDALPDYLRRPPARPDEWRFLESKVIAPELIAIPVVVATSSPARIDLPHGSWTTAIEKPFDMPALVDLIDQLLAFDEETTDVAPRS